MNPISTASTGMLSALVRFDSASTALVKSASGQSNEDSIDSVVDQISAGEQFRASAQAFEVANQMQKHLLDIKV
jgi:flagellar hook protein FlgE